MSSAARGSREVGLAALAVAAVAIGLVVLRPASPTGRPAPDAAVSSAVAAPEDIQPPGTELASGLEVQPGSALVGTVMPIVATSFGPPLAADPIGWQAVLSVDGEPLEVWQRYADALGLADVGDPRAACTVTALATRPRPPGAVVDGTGPPERFITEAPLEGENRLDCYVASGSAVLSMVVGTQICCGGGEGTIGVRRASHLYVAVQDRTAEPVFEQAGADELRFERAQSTDGQYRDPVPVPIGALVAPQFDLPEPTALPGPGQRYDDELDSYLYDTDAALVPPGARSLVAPALLLRCNSGLVALLEVPGEPDEAVATIDLADAEGDDPAGIVRGVDADGRSWTAGFISTAGGYYLDLVAVRTADDESTMLITECGD